MKYYTYFITGKGKFRVERVDDKYPVGDKRRYAEYLVDLDDGRTHCSCSGFQAKINARRRGKKVKGKIACKHVKDIIAGIKDGWKIFHYDDDRENYSTGLEVRR